MQNYDSKKMSKAVGRNLPFSFKVAYEVAKYIRGMKVERAIRELKEVQKIKNLMVYGM